MLSYTTNLTIGDQKSDSITAHFFLPDADLSLSVTFEYMSRQLQVFALVIQRQV